VNEKTPIPPPDWEALIEVIAKEIVDERSPARILQVRAKLYDLLTHCIPATTILKVSREITDMMFRLSRLTMVIQTLTFKLMPKLDDSLKTEVVKWSAFYEHRIRTGSVSSQHHGFYKTAPNNLSFIESHFPPRGVCRQIHEDIRRPFDGHGP
jgi:replication factor C subunit 3/5